MKKIISFIFFAMCANSVIAQTVQDFYAEVYCEIPAGEAYQAQRADMWRQLLAADLNCKISPQGDYLSMGSLQIVRYAFSNGDFLFVATGHNSTLYDLESKSVIQGNDNLNDDYFNFANLTQYRYSLSTKQYEKIENWSDFRVIVDAIRKFNKIIPENFADGGRGYRYVIDKSNTILVDFRYSFSFLDDSGQPKGYTNEKFDIRLSWNGKDDFEVQSIEKRHAED